MPNRPTHDQLLELFNYEPDTGRLIYLKNMRPRGKAGTEAGWVNEHGYRRVSIFGNEYAAHVVIWCWMTGQWPVGDVEHEDRNRSNNRWRNLRPATRSQNLMNQGPKFNNGSGFKGVTSRGNSHSVRFRANGKVIHVGSFKTAREAALAYDAAVVLHQGAFALTNKELGLLP